MADEQPTYQLSSPAGPYAINAERLTALFWSKIDKDASGGCWEWGASKYPSGYGRMSYKRRYFYTHRVSYELHKGSIPDGLHIDHLCRNRGCCNPEHLEAVTCGENTRRSPIAVAAINATKTHCVRGHEYTPTNTRVDARGQRSCITCNRWRDRAKWAKAHGLPSEPEPPSQESPPYSKRANLSPTCQKGHPFDEANTAYDRRGSRRCRACQRVNGQAFRDRQAALKGATR